MNRILLVASCLTVAYGQIQTGGLISSAGATIDFSRSAHTSPDIVVANVGALPATCVVGESAFVTAAAAGQQGYKCSATNTWTQNVTVSPAFTGTPTAPTQTTGDNTTALATDAFVTTAIANAIAGVNPAVAVLAASTANVTGTYNNGASGIGAFFTVTATGAFSLDGVSISTIGQRVLLKNQTSGFQNGIYTATVVGAVAVSPVFTRALDYDTPANINSTGAIPVQSGTVNALTSWLLTSTVTTIGTDALTYAQFSISPTVTTRTIASGTSAMGTGAILSTACATVVTTAATGTLSTDAIIWTPNVSIKALTGYTPATTGGLSIAAYPTADNVNFDVCNWSTGSLTPSALTLNWRVVR